MLARWVLKVSKESKVKLAPPAQRARPERLALKVPLALTAHKAYKVTSARWASKVSKESKVRPAKLAQQAQLVLRVM